MFAKKNYSIIALFFTLLTQTTAAQNYRQLFGCSYVKAEQSAQTLKPLLHQYAQQYQEDERMLEAIVFPELMRYNRLFDVVETGSLMGLYSRFGSAYANFSIGLMQMKPTFALSLEKFVYRQKPAWMKSLQFNQIKLADNHINRSARISRLNDAKWQVRYLVACLKTIRYKHQAVWNQLSANQKVRFAATAYNCGWNQSTATIQAFINKPYFHLKPWDADEKYCFSDVALYRYQELTLTSTGL